MFAFFCTNPRNYPGDVKRSNQSKSIEVNQSDWSNQSKSIKVIGQKNVNLRLASIGFDRLRSASIDTIGLD